jgi:hypothetical protein
MVVNLPGIFNNSTSGGSGPGDSDDGDDDGDDDHNDDTHRRSSGGGGGGGGGGRGGGERGSGSGGGNDNGNGNHNSRSAAKDEEDEEDEHAFEMDDEEEEQLQAHLAETRIWGTDVNVQTCLNVFRNFIEFFGLQEDGRTSHYLALIEIMHQTGDMLLNLNCTHLKTFPGKAQTQIPKPISLLLLLFCACKFLLPFYNNRAL